MDTVLTFLGLAFVGFAAGTVNTIAGGGSLLTLPALIFFGLPAGVAMLIMAVATILRPRRWIARWSLLPDRAVWRVAAEICMLLGLGLYAGFLQAGVGVFALAVIVACRNLDLVRANAIKACLVLVITAPALAIFLWKDLVAWGPGLSVACGQVAGGWVGARLTMQRGASFVRWVVVCVVCVSATKLLGLW